MSANFSISKLNVMAGQLVGPVKKKCEGCGINESKKVDRFCENCFEFKISTNEKLSSENSNLLQENKKLNERILQLNYEIQEKNDFLKYMQRKTKEYEQKIMELKKINSEISQDKNDFLKKKKEYEKEIMELKKIISEISPKTLPKKFNQINLDDLTIYKEFASGSFGTLSLAVDKQTGSHKYAIKTISTSKKDEEEITREIQIWEKFDKSEKTSALPKYYNYFREEISSKIRKTIDYHLVFDYFPKSLKEVIDDLKQTKDENDNVDHFPLKKLFNFSRKIINTLAYMQTFKVCHRDLKPDNFMVDEKCENVFVIDFGESKIVKHYNTNVFKTLAGTPKYLSPELFKVLVFGGSSEENLKKLNIFKSDVFALGLVLLKLGILKLPKRDKDEKIYEKNIEKCILEFGKTYRNEAEMENFIEELDFLLDLLRQSLVLVPAERPDFIELFLKMMENESYEKIREIILASDKSEKD